MGVSIDDGSKTSLGASNETQPVKYKPLAKSVFGLVGILVGLSGTAAGFYRHQYEPVMEQSRSTSGYVAQSAKDLVAKKLTGKSTEATARREADFAQRQTDWQASKTALKIAERVLGVIAIICVFCGFFRREKQQLLIYALGIGIGAIFFDYVVAALLVMLVLSLLSSLAC